MSCENLLEVQNLCQYFPVTKGTFKRKIGDVKAVDHVSLAVRKGETLGIVGESGCGKTTMGRCIVRLNKPTGGHICFRGEDGELQDIFKLNKQDSFRLRKKIQIVFQDPYASLNPAKNIFTAFDEPLKLHGVSSREKRYAIASGMMETVNLSPRYLERYPHEFSSGQRQRICIAKALAMNPELIVCDEPVSALDVSIQAQIMNLMRRLQKEYTLTYLFIAHDLSVVKYMSDRIAVMYLGKIVELAESTEIVENCEHPYTKALMSAVPIPKLGAKKEKILLTGDVPSPLNPPSGCRFHPRCSQCMEICREKEPELREISGRPGHYCACYLVGRTE